MIEDFGKKITGAAKDRWQSYRHRIHAIGDGMIASSSLSEVFPEPAYKTLAAEGVDPWTLAFIRSIRDSVPRKPGKPARLHSWAITVGKLRRLCTQLLDGVSSREEIEELLERSEKSNKVISTRIEMYLSLGHDHSLKSFEIKAGLWKRFNKIDYDPQRFFCQIQDPKSRTSVSGETIAEAVEAFKESFNPEQGARGRKAMRFDVYRNSRSGEIFIGRKLGGDVINLMSFPSEAEARSYLVDNEQALAERFETLRQSPEERRSSNHHREGLDRRSGQDVTPEMFHRAFGFRGVQFGNYVEASRRQADLNNTYDALMDLAEVLGCDASDLSLKGSLGLAFGARGRGGKGAAAAHYEPGQIVINLTKANGAGSLAHEWFHALDNHLGRRAGSPNLFGTEMPRGSLGHLTFEDREEIGACVNLMSDLAKTGIKQRSAQLDRFRSSPYYTQPCEIAARCFESWVIDELDRRDIRNDFLANTTSEEVYTAEARLMGHEDNRYPYPLVDEMPAVRNAFTRLFDPESAMMRNLPGHIDATWDTPVRPPQAAPERAQPVAEEPPVPPQPEPATGAVSQAAASFDADHEDDIEFEDTAAF